MKRRIFTFGCSFTEYTWPTWADMILYNNEGVNYGICGGGFENILNNLVQCDFDYKLTPEDVIVIVYPNLLRWDCAIYPKPKGFGNAMTSPWAEYKEELWNIDVKTPNLSEDTIKWNNIRETCDSFDIEMQNKMFKK